MNRCINKLLILFCVLCCFTLSSCITITIDYGDLNQASKVELIYFDEESDYIDDHEVIRELSSEECHYVSQILSLNNEYSSMMGDPVDMGSYALLFVFDSHKMFYCNSHILFWYDSGESKRYYPANVKQYVQIMTY